MQSYLAQSPGSDILLIDDCVCLCNYLNNFQLFLLILCNVIMLGFLKSELNKQG